jgi:hypothetical protein
MNHPEPPTLHYTELPPPGPNDPLAVEWYTYIREVARLLAEGQEGRHVLIKGEEIVGIYDTHVDALGVAYQRFLDQPFCVHQIQTRERVYRVRSYFGLLPSGGVFMNHQGQPTIHYTQQPPPGPNDPLAVEWHTYMREVPRLLAEGQEGRHVLIKGEEIIGIYDTHVEALTAGYQRYLDQPFCVHQIQTWERVYRVRGY